MLLRVNSEMNGEDLDLQAITQGDAVDSGVPGGALLTGLVEQTLANDQAALASTRQRIANQISAPALVDAAAVVGNFQRMVRIADGTGIPLDRPVAIMSADLRDELGINAFGSAQLTPPVGRLQRWLGRFLAPLIMRRLARSRAPADP